jgi:hypothetical protein
MSSADLQPPATPTVSDPKSLSAGSVLLTWAPVAAGTERVVYEVLALPTNTLHETDGRGPYSTATECALRLDGLEQGADYTFEVRARTSAGRSDPAKVGPVTAPVARASKTWNWTSLGLVVAAFACALFLEFPNLKHVTSDRVHASIAFACVVWGAAAALLAVSGWNNYGLWRMIVGRDGRVSTSQLQTTLWTGLVAFMLAYFTARTWIYNEPCLFDGLKPADDFSKNAAVAHGCLGAGSGLTTAWDDYLVLLGGPFAAFVAARQIVTSKVQNQTLQKTLPDDGTASLQQAVTDDDGNVDLVDAQYLIFNVVALAYVIVGFAEHLRLPAVPALLMALSGSSAATYVLNKVTQDTAPMVTSVMPSTARPGDAVVISGTNLVPSGSSQPPTVSIGGLSAIVNAPASASRVTAIVPAGVQAGMQDLLVTTAARATTQGRPMQILEDRPVIVALMPPSGVLPGDALIIEGQGFASAIDRKHFVSVRIGDDLIAALVQPTPAGLDRVAVHLPETVARGRTVEVSVTTPRQVTSAAAHLTIG